ncbi:MAG: Tim44/TimA family putative adaptor protein [Holosporales bacterium]|jgi:predicted lipid-binding transport protein (Tim44 family)|nr:Tim44/TimA family putative adaptor protein [Holosporales bacterium]
MLSVILGVIAFLLFLKLFKEFGKHGEIPVNTHSINGEKLKKNVNSNIADCNTLKKEKRKKGSDLSTDIATLQKKISDFLPNPFLKKAEEMFDTIFNSFVSSHYHVLRSMLEKPLYESFVAQIQKREARHLMQEILIKHKKTTLDKVQLLKKKAKLLVSFDVSQMSAIVNSEGVSFDNPKRIYREILHKWIFERGFDEENWILTKISFMELQS